MTGQNKTDFSSFKVGTVFNRLPQELGGVKPVYRRVKIRYPSRLNAMAIDPSRIASNQNLVYTAGEIIFKVKIYKSVEVSLLDEKDKFEVAPGSCREVLIRHAALLMKDALGIRVGLKIGVENRGEIKHAGLGSSSGLIASVAVAINELFGKKIKRESLLQYLPQNHGEEISESKDRLSPVQCLGGSAAGGLYPGSLLVITGKNRMIASTTLKPGLKVIIGIPRDFVELDAETLLKKEIESFDGFINCGKRYGKTIAYRILHEVLPAMREKDLKTVGDLIYDYRYKMGSIKNCSYAYPPLVEVCNHLAFLKKEGIAEVVAISSVGPGIFAITENLERCRQAFKKENLEIYVTELENKSYQVLESEPYEKR